MASVYLQLDYGKGKFFQYSKEEQEGYEKHENTKGTVSYRKYIDAIQGELVSMRIEKNEKLKGAEELTVSLKDTDGNYINATFGLLDSKDNYSSFSESLIRHLPNMKRGEIYYIQPFNFKNDKDRELKGFSIKINDSKGEKVQKLSQSYIGKDGVTVAGDIPAVIWVEKRGKNTPDKTAQQDYLYEVLEKAKTELEFKKSESTPQPEPIKASVNTPVLEEGDDLPF